MITVRECRRLLGPGYFFTDDQLKQLRNELYLEAYLATAGVAGRRLARGTLPWSPTKHSRRLTKEMTVGTPH